MSRSVVRAGTARCDQCLLPPRWCLCGGPSAFTSPIQVDVLIHQCELWRPTSTGRLIQRVVQGSRLHLHQRGTNPDRHAIVNPARELWILHPRGQTLDPTLANTANPSQLQILLLDGNWNEAGDMLRAVEPWGRRVRLPLDGSSRYWLREQRHPELHSTVEALIGVYRALNLPEPESSLRLHFELLVYACLRSRGHLERAEEYLSDSPIRTALAPFLEQLHQRRPNLCSLRAMGKASAPASDSPPKTGES